MKPRAKFGENQHKHSKMLCAADYNSYKIKLYQYIKQYKEVGLLNTW